MTENMNELNEKIIALTDEEMESVTGGKHSYIEGDNGKSYVLCLHHIDRKDGDCWWVIVGKNGGGFELAFAPGAETNLGPVFKAEPMDEEGTLVTFIEQTATDVAAG